MRIIYSDATVDEMAFVTEYFWWKQFKVRINPKTFFDVNDSLTAAKMIVKMYHPAKLFYRRKFERCL